MLTTAWDFGVFFGNCVLLTPGAIIMVGFFFFFFFFFDFLPPELEPEELDEDEDGEDDEDEELDEGGPPPPLKPQVPLQHRQAQQTYHQVDRRHQFLPLDDLVASAG